MQVIRNYAGTPPPAPHEGPPLHIQAGDTVELLRGDAHSLFWQVRSQGRPWMGGAAGHRVGGKLVLTNLPHMDRCQRGSEREHTPAALPR